MSELKLSLIDVFTRTTLNSEVREAINLAKEGQLSPYWQSYHISNLMASENKTIATALMNQLREAILQQEQITNEQYYRQELSAIGSIPLFFFSKNCGTIMGIAYSTHTAMLSCDIDIDRTLSQSERAEHIYLLRNELYLLLDKYKIPSSLIASYDYSEKTDTDHFQTMTEAIGYMLYWLNSQVTPA